MFHSASPYLPKFNNQKYRLALLASPHRTAQGHCFGVLGPPPLAVFLMTPVVGLTNNREGEANKRETHYRWVIRQGETHVAEAVSQRRGVMISVAAQNKPAQRKYK